MRNCESDDLLLEATELRLGLPGTGSRRSTNNETKKQSCSSQSHSTKRTSSESGSNSPNNSSDVDSEHSNPAPPRKAQIVGWPPVRSNRQIMNSSSSSEMISYVKVSMDGAPYLRKIDLRLYKSYHYLVSSLETMFKCTIGSGSGSGTESEFVATYEDKDGDWMLAGDVPWEMFITSCKRIRVMKASDAKGLGCCI